MTLPRVQPIIPTWKKEPFDHPDWVFDLKYDGFRGLCYVERGRCRFISRNGNLLSRFEALAGEVSRLLYLDVILDGEVTMVNETGRPQLYDLRRHARAPAYGAFDILWSTDSADLRSLPLSERRKRLQAILPAKSSIISEALSVTGRGHELFDLMCANDPECIVAKRLVDPYEPRVRWLKIKNRDYSQKEGRSDLFNGPRQRPAH